MAERVGLVLPQMMPLPWILVFSMIFFCLYTVSIFIRSFSFCGLTSVKSMRSSFNALP